MNTEQSPTPTVTATGTGTGIGAEGSRQALIVSGSGRYGDPWHPFAATSALLAELLTSAGFAVTVEDDLDDAMTRLAAVSLLVVNAGDPWRDATPEPPPAASIAGFRQAVEDGIAILAMHTAPATMRGYPDWAPTVGAVWLPGISCHPPIGSVDIAIHDRRFGGPDAVGVVDERYCHLQPIGRSEIVATHQVEGATHPAAWLRTVGRSRVAVDLLGHDERSYASEGHRALVVALARWATEAGTAG